MASAARPRNCARRQGAVNGWRTLTCLPLPGPLSSAARIVELVGFAKSADAAHCRHALLPCEEAAIGSTAAASAVYGTPWIRIIRIRLSLRPCRSKGRCNDWHRQYDRSISHAILLHGPEQPLLP